MRRETLVLRVNPAQLVLQEDQDLMECLEKLVLPERLDLEESRERTAHLGYLDEMEPQDCEDLLGNQALWDHLESQGRGVMLEDGDHEDRLGQLVNGALLEKMVPQAFLGHPENRALQEREVSKEIVEKLVVLGLKVLRVDKVRQVNLDPRDLVEPKELQGVAVLMVQKERLEKRDQLEKMGLRVLMGRMVHLVFLE